MKIKSIRKRRFLDGVFGYFKVNDSPLYEKLLEESRNIQVSSIRTLYSSRPGLIKAVINGRTYMLYQPSLRWLLCNPYIISYEQKITIPPVSRVLAGWIILVFSSFAAALCLPILLTERELLPGYLLLLGAFFFVCSVSFRVEVLWNEKIYRKFFGKVSQM
ncbi:MAG: hypothetical protein WBF53_02405 [Litorimonas sp.]